MKDLIIIGAGGFGREVAWLVERTNALEPTWNLLGFLDDNRDIQGSVLNGYKVLGTTDDIANFPEAYFVCAIANTTVRRKLIEKAERLIKGIKFATLIDPGAICSSIIEIGEGTVICAGAILTVNIKLGRHVIVDVGSTVGHDAVLRDHVTLYPGVNVSGTTDIGSGTEIGTGAQILQMLKVGSNSMIGAGAVVINDIPDGCTAVGCPAKPIKFSEKS